MAKEWPMVQLLRQPMTRILVPEWKRRTFLLSGFRAMWASIGPPDWLVLHFGNQEDLGLAMADGDGSVKTPPHSDQDDHRTAQNCD